MIDGELELRQHTQKYIFTQTDTHKHIYILHIATGTGHPHTHRSHFHSSANTPCGSSIRLRCVSHHSKSGQTLVNIAKDLKLFYVNQLSPNRHTREDPVHGTSDILDMAFFFPGFSSRDISFLLMITWTVITYHPNFT